MACTSNSPRRVVAVALEVGRRTLPLYYHRFAPRKFTQPQLFACLVLMVFEGWDYRTTEAHLRDLPGLREWIGLKDVPDHSTLHRASLRFFGAAGSRRLLTCCVRLVLGRRRVIRRAAADSTGLESRHVSPYFVRRRQRGQDGKNPWYQTLSYTRYPKLTLLADCQSHLVLTTLTGRGPRPDLDELAPLLDPWPRGLTLQTLVADAGFDSAANHRCLRQEHGITLLAPPKHGRPRKDGGPPTDPHRRHMYHLLQTRRRRKRCGYTQRWQVETVHSMIKRNLSDELTSRSYHAQCREMRRLAIVHNIMV